LDELLSHLKQTYDVNAKIRLLRQFFELFSNPPDTIQATKDELQRLSGRIRKEAPKWAVLSEKANLVDMLQLCVRDEKWTKIKLHAGAKPLDSLEQVWQVVAENSLDEDPPTINAVTSPLPVVAAASSTPTPTAPKASKRKNNKKRGKQQEREEKEEQPNNNYCFRFMQGRGCDGRCNRSHDTQSLVCTFCQGKRHIEACCPAKRQVERARAGVDAVTFASLAQLPSVDPVQPLSPSPVATAKLDSGASAHFFPLSHMVPATARLTEPTKFVTAGGGIIESRVMGDVVMQAQGSGVKLTGVYDVEGLVSPLVSVGHLTN
jgi:hypothetical protein